MLADADIELLDDAGKGCVRLPLADGLDLAIGGDGFGKRLVGSGYDTNLDRPRAAEFADSEEDEKRGKENASAPKQGREGTAWIRVRHR